MITDKKAFQDYLALEKKYSLHTQKAYCDDLNDFERFLKDALGGIQLEKVGYGHIRSWVIFLVDSNLANVTVNRKVASLKAFYKFLLKVKRIEVSPLLKHRALKTPKNIQIPFSEKEMRSGEEELLSGFESVRNKLIVEMLYATGMRKSELIDLRFVNVNFKEGFVKVLGKRDKERVVPLLGSLVLLVKMYVTERERIEVILESDYFFISSKGLKLSQSFVYRTINLYFSGVSEKVKKSPHIVRHTFATHMLNNGADLNSIKELLGHSSLASTQIYTNSSLSELKKVYKEAHPRSRK
ncbi:MAG: tyrosine-type recombinase/integrase [Flavobacterium sp.]